MTPLEELVKIPVTYCEKVVQGYPIISPFKEFTEGMETSLGM